MENEEMIKVMWSDKPVLTTAQLAAKYACSPDNISENYNRAKEHFKEGVHYYKLTGGNLREFKRQSGKIGLAVSPYASVVYLWTEEGCLYHCKMINTVKAWEVFAEMERVYFNSLQIPLAVPPAILPPRKPISESACAYVFDMSDDTVKIGHTGDIEDRKARMKREHGLDVRQEHHTPPMERPVARRIEKKLHKKYARFKVSGEFYRADFAEVSEELDRLSQVEIDLYEEEIIEADYEREKLLVAMLNARLDSPLKEELFKETANLLLGRRIF